MVKSDLVRRIVELNPNLKEAECRQLVESVFNAMTEHLSKGGDIELRGFGRFIVTKFDQRTVCNPRSREFVDIRTVFGFRFRAFASLGALLNGRRAH